MINDCIVINRVIIWLMINDDQDEIKVDRDTLMIKSLDGIDADGKMIKKM